MLQAVEMFSAMSLLTGGMISMSSKGEGFTYLGRRINFQFSKKYDLISQKQSPYCLFVLVREREAVVYATNSK